MRFLCKGCLDLGVIKETSFWSGVKKVIIDKNRAMADESYCKSFCLGAGCRYFKGGECEIEAQTMIEWEKMVKEIKEKYAGLVEVFDE